MNTVAEGLVLDDMALKGARTYLQSADLWAAAERRLAGGVGPEARMTMTFRRLTARQVEIVPLGQADATRRIADLRVAHDGGTTDYVLAETDAEVTARIDCPEARLLPTILLGDSTASMTVPDFATPLECLVAATKALHLAVVQSEVKWVVGRVDLPLTFLVRPGLRVTSTITHRLPRQSTVSTLEVSGQVVGTMMFNILRQGA